MNFSFHQVGKQFILIGKYSILCVFPNLNSRIGRFSMERGKSDPECATMQEQSWVWGKILSSNGCQCQPGNIVKYFWVVIICSFTSKQYTLHEGLGLGFRQRERVQIVWFITQLYRLMMWNWLVGNTTRVKGLRCNYYEVDVTTLSLVMPTVT